MNIININAKNQAQADKAIDLLAEAFGYQATIQSPDGEVANPQSAYDFVNERFMQQVNEYINEGNNRKLLKTAQATQPDTEKIKIEKGKK